MALGLTAAASSLVVSLLLALVGVPFEIGLIVGLIASIPLELRLQPLLMKRFRRGLGRLERVAARESVVSRDKLGEPFVLLLRGVADDELMAPGGGGLASLLMFPNRLERWIVDALSPAGRVIAIGRPSEDLPHSGAERLYITGAEWRPTVEALIDRATAIVVLVGDGSGVCWEIDTVLRRASLGKTAFVFPFAPPDGREVTGSHRRTETDWARSAGPLFERFQAAARDRLGALPVPARNQQVLVFDRDGRPTFLPNVMSPTYYTLLINPVYILLSIVARLVPSFPWRMSIEGEISYK